MSVPGAKGAATSVRAGVEQLPGPQHHLRTLFDDEVDSKLLHSAAQVLVQADVPRPALAALRVGRMVASQKPNGTRHGIAQSDGGEQGDPLMPASHAIAQQPALHDVQAALSEGEARPSLRTVGASAGTVRVLPCGTLGSYGFGRTRIWNAAGEEPRDVAELQPEGGVTVWVGDWSFPQAQQGLIVLGAPIGNMAYVQRQLQLNRDEHDRLLERILAVEDLQAASLLLRHCACPRANYCFTLSRLPSCQRALLGDAARLCRWTAAFHVLGCVELLPTGMRRIGPLGWTHCRSSTHVPQAWRPDSLPYCVNTAARQAFLYWWTGLLAIATQRPLAHSLLERPLAGVDACSGAEPPLGKLLGDARGSSRLLAPTGERS